MKPWPGKLDARLYELSTPSTAHRLVCTASAALRANLAQSSAPDALTRGVSERSPMLTSSKTMVLLMTLRRASTLAPRVAWKPKATLSGRLEGLLQAPAEKDDPAAAERLKQWLSGKRHVVVLTGAGLSTDSGIPDYRGKAGSYRLGHVPIGHDEFMRNESSRRRYWARALVGCGPVWKSNFRRTTPSTRVPIIHWLMSTQVSGLCGGEAQ